MRAKKSLGQNFLFDQNIAKKIVKQTILNNKNFFYVACGKQTVFSINLIQKPGKNILRFSEFLRGSKINVGEIFD